MRILRALPFVGRLSDCSWDDLSQAFIEVLVVTIFSTMPLWFLPVLSGIFFRESISGYEAIKTGELFLFSTAFVGPLAYIITKNYGERIPSDRNESALIRYSIRFPHGTEFVFTCVAICLISSFAFLVLRNPFFQSNEISKLIDYNGVVKFSWITSIISTIVFYCACAYRNGFESIARTMTDQERSFADEWKASK